MAFDMKGVAFENLREDPEYYRNEAWNIVIRDLRYAAEQGLGKEVFFEFLHELGVRDPTLEKIREAMASALWEWDC